MAQSVGPTASATAGATDASGGVGGSDVQLDDAEVWLHREHPRFTARLASPYCIAETCPFAAPLADGDAMCR